MAWIYLSPHFDDAVLSCGGLIWEQVRRGERVEIWTVCAGAIPPGPLSPFAAELHARWGTGMASVEARRAEAEREAAEAARAREAALGGHRAAHTEAAQQSMVSSVPNRHLTDPTTWGDLVLK